jgi:hypothetical protein
MYRSSSYVESIKWQGSASQAAPWPRIYTDNAMRNIRSEMVLNHSYRRLLRENVFHHFPVGHRRTLGASVVRICHAQVIQSH